MGQDRAPRANNTTACPWGTVTTNGDRITRWSLRDGWMCLGWEDDVGCQSIFVDGDGNEFFNVVRNIATRVPEIIEFRRAAARDAAVDLETHALFCREEKWPSVRSQLAALIPPQVPRMSPEQLRQILPELADLGKSRRA